MAPDVPVDTASSAAAISAADCGRAPGSFAMQRITISASGAGTSGRTSAMGRGASLNAMADLMNVPAAKRAVMFVKFQNNFDKIFTSDKIGADEIVKNMASVLNS